MARFSLQRQTEAAKTEARAEIEQLKQSAGTDSRPDTYLTIARLQMDLGSFEEAIESLIKVLDLDARHWTARLNLAKCYEKLNRWPSAAAEFRKALELEPDRPEAMVGYGICLLHLSKPAEALKQFEAALELHPADVAAQTGRNAAEMLLTRLQQSGRKFGKIRPDAAPATPAPPPPDPLVALRESYDQAVAAGDLPQALRCAEELVQAAPTEASAWFALGLVQQLRGDLHEARGHYTKAAELNPDEATARLNAAIVAQQLGDARAARQELEALLKVAPRHTAGLWNLALLCEQAGDWKDAERLLLSLTEAAASPRETAAAWLHLGALRLNLGEFAEASAALEQSLAADPESADARLHLAISYWKQGRNDSARHAFEAVLAERPGSADALYGLAVLALDAQDCDRAFELQSQLAQAGEVSAELAFNIALLLERDSALAPSAVEMYRQAVSADPDFADAWLNLGNALAAAGDSESVACLRRAIELKPELARGYFD